MCGIIGYTGYTDARGKLIKGLKTLEYRGYDSAGIAVFNDTLNEVIVAKCEGRVERLDEKSKDIKGNTGIGHTRWATHRSEEHTSELQSLMRISYAGFCLKKKKKTILTLLL